MNKHLRIREYMLPFPVVQLGLAVSYYVVG
jgi:hypothetical protein